MSFKAQLTELNDKIAVKQTALHALFEGASDLTGNAATDRREAIKQANAELSDLGTKRDDIAEFAAAEDSTAAAMKAMRQPVGRQVLPDNEDPGEAAIKTIRDLLMGNQDFQRTIKAKEHFRGDLGFISAKTLLTTADMVRQTDRLPGVVPYALEERTTADLMLQGRTNSPAIEYYEETTFTNNAAETSEAASKFESVVDFTLRTENVRKIATWIPVTDEMMQDNDQFEDYLRGRLGFMVKQREEQVILTGNGIGQNIQGILNRSGVQTQAKGGDTATDAIFKAITKVRAVGFAEPTAVVIHPNDWQDIRLDKASTSGIYLFGPPSETGATRLWGLEVRVTTNITEGTALVGAFVPYSQLWRRQDIQLAISDSHSTYFIENKLAVRAEERIALAVYRGAAFAKVTGI